MHSVGQILSRIVAFVVAFGLILVLLLVPSVDTAHAQKGKKGPVREVMSDKTITTQRYRIDYYGTDTEREDMGKMLDASWPLFKHLFRSEPAVEGSNKLRFRIFADREAMRSAFFAEFAMRPEVSDNFFYLFDNRTVYGFRGPTTANRYDPERMRAEMLRSANQQFYYVARRLSNAIPHHWYEAGLRLLAQIHEWDGKDLRIAAFPMVFANEDDMKEGNLLKDALLSAAHSSFDLGDVVAGKRSPNVHQLVALFSWMYCSSDEVRRKFWMFCDRVDKGGEPLNVFQQEFGRPERAKEELVAWLRGMQSPFFRTAGSVTNRSLTSVSMHYPKPTFEYSMAVTSTEKVSWIEATLATPRGKTPNAGIVFSYTAPTEKTKADIVVGRFNDEGKLEVIRFDGRAWNVIAGPFEAPTYKDRSKGKREMRAEHDGDKLVWKVDGKEVARLDIPLGKKGLYSTAEANFSDVACEGYNEPKPTARRR